MDRFRATTGLPISTYSSALKLAWILDDGWRRARGAAADGGDLLFGTIDTLADLEADRRRPTAASTSPTSRTPRGRC